MKKFYRVSNVDSQQGLWYSYDGTFTGLIHDKFNFCKNKDLPMPFDQDLVGWLSATDELETIFNWFTKEDILKLQEHGYYIHEYETDEYREYRNHWVIKQDNHKIIQRIKLPINTTEDYCSFEVSKLLKKKGFIGKSQFIYAYGREDTLIHNISPLDNTNDSGYWEAPTHGLAIKWIRDNFGWHIYPIFRGNNMNTGKWDYIIDGFQKKATIEGTHFNSIYTKFDKPEEAVEAALLRTLKELI